MLWPGFQRYGRIFRGKKDKFSLGTQGSERVYQSVLAFRRFPLPRKNEYETFLIPFSHYNPFLFQLASLNFDPTVASIHFFMGKIIYYFVHYLWIICPLKINDLSIKNK